MHLEPGDQRLEGAAQHQMVQGQTPPPTTADPSGFYRGHPLGSWSQRFAAHLIDVALTCSPLLVAFAGLGIMTLSAAASSDGQPSALSAILGSIMLMGGALACVALQIYNFWYLQGTRGHTWGKRKLGLRLVRSSTGQPVGLGVAFLRGAMHNLLDGNTIVGYLWPLWDARRQTFADKVCNTVVIGER